MRSNTKWVWIALILLTVIGLQFYALYMIPQTHAKEIQAVQVQKETLEQQSTQMESKLNELKRQLSTVEENYQKTLEKLEVTKTSLEETKETVKELKKDLEESHNEIKKLEQVKREQEEENKRLERQLQSRLQKRQVQIASRSRSYSKEYSKNETTKAPSNVLTGFEVTWYNLSGTTASGRPTQDGVTIAVDPNVIPLGTWVKIYFPDGTVLKRRADDVGGAVKGRKIDIYKNAPTEHLLSLGRKKGVKVEILD
jgi:3D (Asp-Asp-Asp) domain-containing protein